MNHSLLRHLITGILLLGFSAAVLAQTTVPYTFTFGTPARATEVNANAQALATAIDNLAARISKLEGVVTEVDIAGTYAMATLAVNSAMGTPPAPTVQWQIHHENNNGTFVLKIDRASASNCTGAPEAATFTCENTLSNGVLISKTCPKNSDCGIYNTFTFSLAGNHSSLITNYANTTINLGNNTAVGVACCENTVNSTNSQSDSGGGTWSLSGNKLILTFVQPAFYGTVTMTMAAGPSLFVGSINNESFHQLGLLMRAK